MEKVKTFWKSVLKEREEFWGSLFQKYEDENSETDVSSYLDNTSQRINELLKLAALSDEENQSGDDYPVPERYYEEQPEPNDNWDGFTEELKVKSPIKRPEYISEILPEDEVKSPTSPVKKLKLFIPVTPPKPPEMLCKEQISPSPESLLDGSILNTSVRICRRSKPVTISKRFRLA